MTALPPDPSSWSQEILPSERSLVPYDLDHTARQIDGFSFTVRGDERGESSETERMSIRLTDPVEAYEHNIQSRTQDIYDVYTAYANRLEVLKEQAELDGYSLNRASRDAFVEFLKKNPLIRRSRLVLMENGNLRAVWKGEKEDHIGLQFISNRSIQYVIFTRREPQFPVSRVSGRDTLDGIKRQIEAFDLDSVLYI